MRVPELWIETVMHDADPFPTKSPQVSNSNQTPPQNDQPTRRNMHDSYCEVVLAFGSSPKLLEQYTNVHGGIRTGKYAGLISINRILPLILA
jgi:acyl-coenzyme A thioesterase 9